MRIDLLLGGYVYLGCSAEDAVQVFEALRAMEITPKAPKRYEKSGEIRFFCGLREAAALGRVYPALPLARYGQGGLPTLWQGLLHRPGLLCGVLLGVALLILSRLFVWEVEITGNQRIADEELRLELAAAGLSCGVPLASLDTDAVALALRLGDGRIAYAAVNLSGTVARVQIREAVEPPPTAVAPADVVAARDGVVTLPLAFEGECLVREGDVVRAGQVLIRGTSVNGETTCTTRAAGQILARTTHVYTVFVPFVYEERVETGQVGREWYLDFFGFQRIFFKSTGNEIGKYDIIKKTIRWTLSGGRVVPVGITAVEQAFYTTRVATRTAAEAYVLAQNELEARLAADSTGRSLLEYTVERCVSADGVTLLCTVVCEEDIARVEEFDVASPQG